MSYYDPVTKSYGYVLGTLSSCSYHVCEEHGNAALSRRVVFTGDMKQWRFFRTMGEAEVAAEKERGK